jgi:uncharacterized protein (TIGR03437 family)
MKFLLFLLAFAAPAFAQQTCTYQFTPATFLIGPEASPEMRITISAPSGCPWTPTVPATSSWIHISLYSATQGDGFIIWHADKNQTALGRTGAIQIAGQNVIITQGAASCSYTFSPPSATIAPEGGAASLGITATCGWAAITQDNWITIAKPDTGTANGTLSYTVGTNPCINPRLGQIIVGLPNSGTLPQYRNTFNVTQSGSPGGLTTIPTSLSLPAAAGDGRLSVITPTGCTWTATSNVSWFQLLTPTSGRGGADLAYKVTANNGTTRTGIVTIGPMTIPITQAGLTSSSSVQVTSVGNGASYNTDAVSPGEIVAIFGTNLGPTPPVTLQLTPDGTAITKTLAGVQLLFDGTPAPLIFVSGGQINAIVPYNVAGKTSTSIQVQNSNGTSAAVTKSVQPSTPGIFTQDRSGLGPGAILNQDYSLNGSASRAARGDQVSIYLTGAGVTNPASPDGSITTTTDTPPALTLPVSVTIGGVDAPVLYQGAAPGSVAGLTQINAKIPDGATGILPVVVQIGTAQSQAGVTVGVK